MILHISMQWWIEKLPIVMTEYGAPKSSLRVDIYKMLGGHKSLETQLYIQYYIQTNNMEKIKAPHYLVGEVSVCYSRFLPAKLRNRTFWPQEYQRHIKFTSIYTEIVLKFGNVRNIQNFNQTMSWNLGK